MIKKRIAALLIALGLMAAIVPVTARASITPVFMAVNDTLLPFDTGNMPYVSGRVLFVPVGILHGLGVYSVSQDTSGFVRLYSGTRKYVDFDIESGATEDQRGYTLYWPSALKVGGVYYVPLRQICDFFNLIYEIIEVPNDVIDNGQAWVIRITSDSLLNSQTFLSLNAGALRTAYEEYYALPTPSPTSSADTMQSIMAPNVPVSNFVSVNTYEPGQFADVNEYMWYGYCRQKAIASAYVYDLMKGSPGGVFNPAGNVTVAEVIAIAARVHSIYVTGTHYFIQGNPWYQVYVDYAVANGITIIGDMEDYSRPATRAEVAFIFSRSLPQEEFMAINAEKHPPDVAETTPYRDSILMLYRAGVLTGSGDAGEFYPGNPITRAETSAIISRVILPQTRSHG